MVKAFVFGKFLPFHKGHEALIRFALLKCDFLSVLICCSDREGVDGETRKSWIANSLGSADNLSIQIFNYLESELPNTSESSQEVSKLWSARFKEMFPDYNLVVTSEPYGDYVASFMNIIHIPFDRQREIVPVSATAIRQDLLSNWKYLPKSSRTYLAFKVVILGTESTGKSTLAAQLADHYQCTLVTEAGRDLIKDSKDFSYDDLISVAHEHSTRIVNATGGDHPLIIIDTDIHITRSYSRFVFNKDLEVEESLLNHNKADLYLYLKNDVPFVQDGGRLSEEDRNRLDTFHREILQQADVKLIEIEGHWCQRFEKAAQAIDRLLNNNRLTLDLKKAPV
ncbi:AAA family ATPase [Desertivirga arenae]|uniref:AAA family ATPase n=1 Tax=Desertivirga arenae TaxID=2810309 RepID=UPI001A97B716|nr:AAA family ATPase [Pedobacter sp. SYSU D00823]